MEGTHKWRGYSQRASLGTAGKIPQGAHYSKVPLAWCNENLNRWGHLRMCLALIGRKMDNCNSYFDHLPRANYDLLPVFLENTLQYSFTRSQAKVPVFWTSFIVWFLALLRVLIGTAPVPCLLAGSGEMHMHVPVVPMEAWLLLRAVDGCFSSCHVPSIQPTVLTLWHDSLSENRQFFSVHRWGPLVFSF